jgi:hypothetical protein
MCTTAAWASSLRAAPERSCEYTLPKVTAGAAWLPGWPCICNAAHTHKGYSAATQERCEPQTLPRPPQRSRTRSSSPSAAVRPSRRSSCPYERAIAPAAGPAAAAPPCVPEPAPAAAAALLLPLPRLPRGVVPAVPALAPLTPAAPPLAEAAEPLSAARSRLSASERSKPSRPGRISARAATARDSPSRPAARSSLEARLGGEGLGAAGPEWELEGPSWSGGRWLLAGCTCAGLLEGAMVDVAAKSASSRAAGRQCVTRTHTQRVSWQPAARSHPSS